MSALTLDEILAETGLSREEWQRARPVVEDYWKDHARANGWAPTTNETLVSRVFRFPLGTTAEFTVTAPLTAEQWDVLMEVLTAARVGLVAAASPADTNTGQDG